MYWRQNKSLFTHNRNDQSVDVEEEEEEEEEGKTRPPTWRSFIRNWLLSRWLQSKLTITAIRRWMKTIVCKVATRENTRCEPYKNSNSPPLTPLPPPLLRPFLHHHTRPVNQLRYYPIEQLSNQALSQSPNQPIAGLSLSNVSRLTM